MIWLMDQSIDVLGAKPDDAIPAMSVGNEDLDSEDEQLSRQLYFILALLLKGDSQGRLCLVAAGEGLALYRLCTEEYDPKFRSRSTVMIVHVLGFAFNEPDVMKTLDQFEKLVRAYEKNSGKKIGQDTKCGVVISGLSKSLDANAKNIGEHLVMNSDRFVTFESMRQYLREVCGAKKFMHEADAGAAVNALATGGKPKGGGKKAGKLSLTMAFSGNCYNCGKLGHKSVECWWDKKATGKASKADGGKKGKGKDGGGRLTPSAPIAASRTTKPRSVVRGLRKKQLVHPAAAMRLCGTKKTVARRGDASIRSQIFRHSLRNLPLESRS